MEWISVALWAASGGVFLEALHWYGLRQNPRFPTYARRKKYWAATLLIVILCSVAAVALSQSPGQAALSPITAFALGFSLPSVPHKLAAFLPSPALAGASASDLAPPSIRDFLAS